MELIFEFIYELIIGGSIEITQDKEFPIKVRIVAGTVLFVVLGGLLALLAYCAWDSWSEGSVGGAIVLSVVALALIVLIISVFIKPPKN